MSSTYINSIALANSILLFDGGTVINETTASVTDKQVGIYITGSSAAVFNYGSVDTPSPSSPTNERYGIGVGLAATSANYLYNGLNGRITSNNTAVEFGQSSGTVINHGSISGTYIGILGYSAATITNTGLLEASSTTAVTINGIGFAGVGADLLEGGTLYNSGEVIGGDFGVFLANPSGNGATIINSGLIEGTGATINIGTFHYPSTAILMPEGGEIINQKGGSIIGQGLAIQHVGIGTATIINDGLIQALGSGTYSDPAGYSIPGAVILNSGGTVTNQSSGTIIGEIGVQLGGESNTSGGYLDNTGSVLSSFVAIAMFSDATVANSGLIRSEDSGIVLASNDIHVTNSRFGLIEGVSFSSFYESSYIGGTVSNFGTLIGGQGGIAMKGSTLDVASIVNGGTIIGTDTTFYYDNGESLGLSSGVNVFGAANIVNESSGVVEGQIGEFFTNYATSENAGTIIGLDNIAVGFDGTGDKLIIDPSAVFEGQIIDYDGDGTLEFKSSSTAGVISGNEFSGFSTIEMDGGSSWTITNALTVGLLDFLADFGTLTVEGATTNDGSIFADPAVLIFESAVTGTGVITVAAGSDVIFHGSVASTETIELASTGTITVYDPAEFNAVVEGSGVEQTLCYLPGTRILTSEGEVCVEDLVPGDIIVTRFSGFQPVKWIGRQKYAPRFLTRERLPVTIAPGALGANLPKEALRISPGHSVLLGTQLILAKNLVNGFTITQDEISETVEYYSIELEVHDCVLANHSWAESFADGPGMRNQFHNAGEFFALFPDYAEPAELFLCAPRPEAGPELEAALLPLLAKLDVAHGRLHGYIEIIGRDKVEGWAWDEANPDMPVFVEICEDGEAVGTALACHYRSDLAEAGLGRGHCMFSFSLSSPSVFSGTITARRASDCAELPLTDDCRAAA